MAEMKPTPVQNPKALLLAKALRAAKDFGNKAQIPEGVPLLGGQGVGDMILGQAPEEVENWGYGNYPFAMPEMSNIPVMKTGRHEGVFDAMSMAPVGAGGTGHAMITAAGDPRLILARATPMNSLMKQLSRKTPSVDYPSFAIGKNKLPDEFGENFILPYPDALDPKKNKSSVLYNLDAYTGYPTEHSGADTRLLFDDMPSEDEYALRIALSPTFKSFDQFERSRVGAKVLPDIEKGEMGKIDDVAWRYVRDKLQGWDPGGGYDEPDPDWWLKTLDYKAEPDNWAPDPVGLMLHENPEMRTSEMRRMLHRLRASTGYGQDHAELKHVKPFKLNKDTVQSLLLPRGTSSAYPEAKELGIPMVEYDNIDDAVGIAKDIQKPKSMVKALRR